MLQKTSNIHNKDEQDEIIRSEFFQNELIKVILQGNRLQYKWLLKHLHNSYQTKHSALLNTLYQRKWIWRVNRRVQSWTYPAHKCTKNSKKESSCFLWKNVWSLQKKFICNLVYTLPLRILLKPWTLSFKWDTGTTKIVSRLNCVEERQKLSFTLQLQNLVLVCLVRTWDTFSEVSVVMIVESCWEEKGITNQNSLTILSAYTLSWYKQIWLNIILFEIQGFPCCVDFLVPKPKAGDIITTAL